MESRDILLCVFLHSACNWYEMNSGQVGLVKRQGTSKCFVPSALGSFLSLPLALFPSNSRKDGRQPWLQSMGSLVAFPLSSVGIFL